MRAIVTGAARGIGAAIVQRLRDDGMEVVTLDLLPGCDLQVDLRSDELPDLPDIDVCVSNAGVTTTIAPAHRMTDEQWDLDLEVNLRGAYRVVRACLDTNDRGGLYCMPQPDARIGWGIKRFTPTVYTRAVGLTTRMTTS